MISPESQKILDEMKPLGEWLMAARPMTRVLGRTKYADENGYAALKAFDKEWAEKNSKFNRLSGKYRKSRAADEKQELL